MFNLTLKKISVITLLSVSLLSLQGCVTAAVVGTVGAVAAATKVATDPRTAGRQIDDETLEAKINYRLNKDAQLKEEARVVVVSYNGKVLLAGQAPNKIAVDTARKITLGQQGVRLVYNEIRIAKKIGAGQITTDAWITTQVKTQLLANVYVKSNNVKVLTENGEVFLMGHVTPKQSQVVINIARHTKGVRKVIPAFSYIKTQ
ncbi:MULTISPECIES: division/outer membrane stress-associated lipid-binding lipoprotein [Pasteurellaceae]|uniref:Division/outer membrane stress-associated lipid-binding lipoprotein n=1 Tax=Pasteurella atlantica TaxID=2827233 RepID=A0AAW8CPJ5_9PAST|nr:division/outer membrane stress-associated lipid-binding lipoprotein [Pasteurella atlantica]MBR0573593.1 divisome-associated lipoprotein YraP [Pasteurella atlantica]MDP8039545.1 division/outer membrane stress-associated lipid-binding lipoprotein [Pasteurella atlantica]MDP8041637.1 division/outer membrane stress-associated lipid-binding lipoprotein [Pasteurella atlantica]MDP8043773.1 division/outer membrane stress-associated lipid-binding lipoprotein [Pasteurella atlantica]MDP8045857.1 divisi